MDEDYTIFNKNFNRFMNVLKRLPDLCLELQLCRLCHFWLEFYQRASPEWSEADILETDLWLFLRYITFKKAVIIVFQIVHKSLKYFTIQFVWQKWIEEHKQDYKGNRTGDIIDAYMAKISENDPSFTGR